MNGEHKRSSADVMVTQTTLIKRLFIPMANLSLERQYWYKERV